jgi:hypothetical protein
MATIVTRFYGRFVFLAAPDGVLRVLALDPTFNSDVGAAPHRLLLAAPRRVISDATTREADTVIMQPDVDDDRAEIALWELAGTKTTFAPDGGFAWAHPPTTPNPAGRALADLDALGGASVHPDHLAQFGEGRPVGAVFEVRSGIGTLGQIDLAPSRFAPLATAQTAADPFDLNLAEFVDVAIDLPSDNLTLRLTVTGAGGTATLAFVTDEDDVTRLTISNLCSGQHTLVDREFASTYEVLSAAPPLPERQVPVTQPIMGRRVNCFKAAHATLG